MGDPLCLHAVAERLCHRSRFRRHHQRPAGLLYRNLRLLRSVVTFIAVFKLRKMPDYKPTYKMPCWQLMALLAVVPTMILLVSTFVWAPGQSMIAAVVAVGTGYPVYLYFKKQNNITAHTGK